MGLFDKKFCDICGEKIGLFGNRKLDDGNLCKECAAKLSPWFSDRRNSTVEEIRGQLEYREANKEAVANFHTTLTLGTGTKILLDEDQRKFMVTSARDLAAANPDVLDYSQITGCNVDIQESKHEMRVAGADGKQVSYNPPQYSREYDIYMVINVNHPYFDQIRFQLNNTDITVEPYIQLAAQPMGMNRPGMAGTAARPGVQPTRPGMAGTAARPGVQPTRPGMTGTAARPGVQPARPGMTGTAARPGVQPARPGMAGTAARPGVQPARPGMAGTAARPAAASASASAAPAPRVISSTPGDPNMNADYIRFVQMGEEIRAHLMGVRQEARDEMEAAAAPQQAVTCPWCGATTNPDASGCCEYCGGAVNG